MQATSDGNVHYLPFASQQIWHSRQDKHVVTSDEGKGGGRAIISSVINDGAGPCEQQRLYQCTTMSMK